MKPFQLLKLDRAFCAFAPFIAVAMLCQNLAAETNATYLKSLGRVSLEGVEGRLDHLAADPVSKRLFIAGLENHSVEVVNLTQQKRIHEIHGVLEPQGIALARGFGLLLVGSRGDGTCRSFDANTFDEGAWIDLGRNADNVRFDAASRLVYVGSGAEPGPGLMSAISLESFLPANRGGKQTNPPSHADLLFKQPHQALALGEANLKSHPESFQVDPLHNRVYINVPDEHEIVVLETKAGVLKYLQSWPVTVAEKNFPMSLDAAHSRLFIVGRKPACVLAYDTGTGNLTAQIPCVGDSDDIYYDAQTQRLYVIGGEGFVDIIDASDTSKLTRLAQVPTVPKARTGLFIPELNMLAVAVPHTTNGLASILLFQVAR